MGIAVDRTASLRAAREDYFARGGGFVVEYDEWWARGRFEGIEFRFPNPPAHGRALRCHDLHHVLTGYGTDWIGELEISAWELGGGCGRYVAAFGFDLAGTALGFLLAPKRTLKAYARGRRTSNLFWRGYERALLDRTVGEMRRELGLDREIGDPTAGDVARFVAWQILGLPWVALAPLSAVVLAATCLAPAPRERAHGADLSDGR